MSPRGKSRVWPSAAVVFVVALAVRLAHVLALRESPYFARPVLDAETYYWAARALAAGEGWAERVYWQPPGYPYFLAAVLRVAGPGFLAPRLVQAVLGALTAALTCALGARVFGRAVGLGAGLVVALYGLLIYYDAELLAPSLAISLQMATLWSAARAPDERGGRGWLLTGLLGGLTAVVNAPALVLLPVLGIAARRRIGWVLLGAILAIAPVTARNWIQGRELVLISSNGGINLYLGNNPRYDETVGLRPGRDWQALVRAPALQGVTGAGPASRFFTERVSAYAGQDPGGFVRLQVRKIGLLLQGNEIPRNQEIYPTRTWSPVLRALLWKAPGIAFPFGLLLPLAVVGLGVAGRRAPVLAASVVLLGLTVVAFFVTARYRAPLVPLLALFAAAAVRWAVVEASPRARLAAAAVAAAVYLLANARTGTDAVADERRRRAGPGPLARERGPAPGGPRAVRAARPGGADLVRRLVRRRPAGDRARPARQGGGGSHADPRAPARVPGHRGPSGAGCDRRRLRARGGGLRGPRGGPRRRQRPGPTAHGGGGDAARLTGREPRRRLSRPGLRRAADARVLGPTGRELAHRVHIGGFLDAASDVL